MNNDRLIELLTESVRWLRFQGLDKAKSAVEENLDSEKKRRVFDLTDGTTAGRKISELSGVPLATISAWWNDWYAAGILTKEDGKYRRLFKLSEIGIKGENEPNGTQKSKNRV
jgi:hypothetical protein